MEDENDESWLYGNSEKRDAEEESPKEETSSKAADEAEPTVAVDEAPESTAEQFTNEENDETSQMEDSMQAAFHEEDTADLIETAEEEESEVKAKKSGEDEDDLDDDSEDDDINIVIGDIKSGPSYNIKQRGQAANAANTAGGNKVTGKFNIEEFESVGTISGVPAHEFSIDSLEEKPWRKPGADITDYFNYGFNEDTWRAYCERQKRYRLNESGIGLASLSSSSNMGPMPQNGMGGLMKRPPPMGRRGIETVGSGRGDLGPSMKPPSRENVIQVMTADRREYSRMNRSFEVNEPGGEPNFFEESQFDYMNYEPTQDSQWQNNPGWGPSGVKELTPGMNMPPPGGPGGPGMPMGMGPMGMNMNMGHHGMGGMSQRGGLGGFDRTRGLDRDRRRRDRSRSRSPRGLSRRPRSRSRERSRRPRSRSHERARYGRSKSRERKKSRSPGRYRERRSKSREGLRDAKRSKSPKKSKSRERDGARSKHKDKDRDREKSVKPAKDEGEKSEKEVKDKEHKKEKKKKKDKEKSDSD